MRAVVERNISIELTAIAHDLLTPLTKCDKHVRSRRVPNISPQIILSVALRDSGDVLRANRPSEFIVNELLTQCFGNIFATLSNNEVLGSLPTSASDRPNCNLFGGGSGLPSF